jgi:hypothetical protein
VVSRRDSGRIDTVLPSTVARRPAERWSSSGCCRVGTREHSSRQMRRARLLLAGKGAVPDGSAIRRPFGLGRCTPPSAVALAWPDDKLRCVCGPKHPRWLQDVLAAGHSSRSSRGSRHGRGSGQPHPARIEDKVAATQQKTARSIASGWGRGRRAGSIVRRQQIRLHGQPGGTNEQYLLSDPNCCPSGSPTAARSLPPYVPQRQDHHRPRRPRRLRFGDQGHPRPDAACLVGSVDQHPVAWCQSCGTRAPDQAAAVIGRVGSAVLQRLERAHNFAEREPITSVLTVGRHLGKRRSAQRFPVVPW